jgi:hypothetical protein
MAKKFEIEVEKVNGYCVFITRGFSPGRADDPIFN